MTIAYTSEGTAPPIQTSYISADCEKAPQPRYITPGPGQTTQTTYITTNPGQSTYITTVPQQVTQVEVINHPKPQATRWTNKHKHTVIAGEQKKEILNYYEYIYPKGPHYIGNCAYICYL